MNRARHEPIQRTTAQGPVDGVFVVGMFASGVELLGGALARLGLGGPHAEGAPLAGLTASNDRLVEAASGSAEGPPDVTPTELARQLAQFSDEARRQAGDLLPGGGAGAAPWVWADPRLSLLAPFWSEALGVNPAVILVHRDPYEVVAADLPEVATTERVVRWWDRSN
ncbi:MAG TPA: hypothetical protein VHS57_07670, partial [Acidimicrobiales bacterium]|nr:hypothetical protein [Acidimicrobiales bacterium]